MTRARSLHLSLRGVLLALLWAPQNNLRRCALLPVEFSRFQDMADRRDNCAALLPEATHNLARRRRYRLQDRTGVDAPEASLQYAVPRPQFRPDGEMATKYSDESLPRMPGIAYLSPSAAPVFPGPPPSSAYSPSRQ